MGKIAASLRSSQRQIHGLHNNDNTGKFVFLAAHHISTVKYVLEYIKGCIQNIMLTSLFSWYIM